MKRDFETRLYRQLGETIKNMRKKASIKQEALADQVHLSRASLVNIEHGRHRVQLHVLYEIAAALNKDVSELLPQMADTKTTLPDDVSRHLRPEEQEPVAYLLSKARTRENK